MQDKIYDVIVIGAGMAGLTAAIYAVRANKKVLVLEGKTHGGQIITTFHIANYPGLPKVSGVDLMNSVYNQAKELGAEIETGAWDTFPAACGPWMPPWRHRERR